MYVCTRMYKYIHTPGVYIYIYIKLTEIWHLYFCLERELTNFPAFVITLFINNNKI